MNRFKEILLKLIDILTEKGGRYRKIVMTLSVVVVFVTTYMLILPAITLVKDAAAELGGIDIPSQTVSADETSAQAEPEALSQQAGDEETDAVNTTEEAGDDEGSPGNNESAPEQADGENIGNGPDSGADTESAGKTESAEADTDTSTDNIESDNTAADSMPIDSEATDNDAALSQAAETDAETESGTEAEATADGLFYEGDGFTVEVTDKKNILPDDTRVVVKEISADNSKQAREYDKLYRDALKAVREQNKAENTDNNKKRSKAAGNSKNGKSAEDSDIISDLRFARFYDITLVDSNGEVEPEKAVDVTIAYRKALQKKLGITDPDKVRIIHFAVDKNTGKITPEILDSRKVDVTLENSKLAETTFEAEGFSIYAVVEEGSEIETARMTLNFYGKDQSAPIATIYVKNDDLIGSELEQIIYDPGVGTLNPGELFKGWTFEQNYTLEDADDAMNIAEVRQWAAEHQIAEGETVNLYAALVRNYTVTYLDERDVSLGTDNVALLASDTTADYTVNRGYQPVDDLHYFAGWNVKEGSSNIADYTSGKTYENGDTITISGNVTLSVNAPEGHWLVFDENGKGATYNAPVFIRSGDVTAKPCDDSAMQRPGYSFGGWYSDAECNTPFTFGEEINDKTTVYAKWDPVATAPYTVIIWKQNIDGDDYDFVESIQLNGTPNSTIDTVTQQGNGNNAYARIDNQNKQYTGFHLNRFDENVTITPEGNAVLNVYYDRNEYTLTFQVEDYTYTQSNNGNYGKVGDTYVRLSDGNPKFFLAYRDGTPVPTGTTVYYRENGWFGQRWAAATDPTNSNTTYYSAEAYNTALTWVRYTGNRYSRSNNKSWQPIKEITALYEQNIADKFPIVGTNGVTYNNGERWKPQANNLGWSEVMVFVETMPNESVTFRLDVAQRPLKTMYYYVEALPSDTENIVTRGGIRYTLYNTISARYNGVTEEDFVELDGFTKVAAAETVNGQALTPRSFSGLTGLYYIASTTQDQSIYFFYSRDSYKINYMDGSYFDGNGNRLDESGHGQLDTSDPIYYQADISSYNKGGDDYYVPTRDGFVFEGWYLDNACTQPYNFTTMPKGGVTVYAKWRQTQYRVFLHPNTTDPSLDLGGDTVELTFRVPIGSTVNTPNPQRNGYELVGWYLDEACTRVIDPQSYVLNDITVTTPYDKTTDMTDVMDKWGNGATWNSDVQDENGNPRDRFWITRKLDLYAKWRAVTEGSRGIGVVYDANGGTNAPTDTTLYLDTAAATAQAASTAPVAAEGQPQQVFLYWVMQKWDEDQQRYVDIPEAPHIFPGDTFEVLKDNARMVVTEWEDEEHTKIKNATYTVQLRAEYGDAESHTPTHIIWYANNGTGNTVADNNLKINQAVDVEQPGGIFTRNGYDFIGWARMTEVSDNDGNITSIGGASPENLQIELGREDLFLEYRGGKFYSTAKTCEGISGPAVGTEISKIAADERLDYHGMVAVWEKKKYTVTVKKVTSDESYQNELFSFTPGFPEAANVEEGTTPFMLVGNPDGAIHDETEYANTKVYEGVPYGTQFSVTEVTDRYDVNVKYDCSDADDNEKNRTNVESANGGSITVDGNITVTFNNTLKYKKLRIRKIGNTDDSAAGLSGAKFSLTSTDAVSFENMEEMSSLPGANLGYLPSGDILDTTLFTLPVGNYILTETDPPEGYDGVSPVAIKVEDEGISITKNDNDIVVLSNPDEHGVYTLTVTDRIKTVPIRVIKVDQEGNALEEAVFRFDGQDFGNVGQGAMTSRKDPDDPDSDALIVMDNEVPIGTYTLHEDKAPDGYNTIEDDVVINVTSRNGQVSVSAVIEGENRAAIDVNHPDLGWTVTIPNSAGVELPHTGGAGTALFYVLGSLLAIGCGMLLISRRRTMKTRR